MKTLETVAAYTTRTKYGETIVRRLVRTDCEACHHTVDISDPERRFYLMRVLGASQNGYYPLHVECHVNGETDALARDRMELHDCPNVAAREENMSIDLHASQHTVRVGRLLYTRADVPDLIEALLKWADEKE